MNDRTEMDSLLLLSNLLFKITGQLLLRNHFYAARADEPNENCVSTLWKTLHQLTCLQNGNCQECTVDCVKAEFALVGYGCIDFYLLPPNQSRGSRCLLHALVWLIATGAVEALIDRKFNCSPLLREFPDDSQLSSVANMEPHTFVLSLENTLRYLESSAVALKHKSLAVDNILKQHTDLKRKIHQATSTFKNMSHFSVNECAMLLMFKDKTNGYFNCLYELCDIAEAHTLWLKRRTHFFKWMDEAIKTGDCTEVKHSLDLKTFCTSLPLLIRNKQSDKFSAETVNQRLFKIGELISSQYIDCDQQFNYLCNCLNERNILAIPIPRPS